MTLAWAIAFASSVLGADLRVDGGARVEGRSRTVDTSGAERVSVVELAARPQAALTLLAPDVELDARYAPVVRAADVLSPARPDVLHLAEVGARLRFSPTWGLRAIAGAERGTTDLLAEARLRGGVPEAVPTTAEIRFASARANLALDGRLDARTVVALGAGWSAGGGDDTESRAVLPFGRSITSNARLEWNASPLDVLTLLAAAYGSRINDGREGGVASLLGTWRHRIDRQIEARVGAGAGVSREDGPAQPRREGLLPVGEAGVAHASERWHSAEEAVVRLGTSLDRVTGAVDRTFEGELSARWAPAPALTFAGRAIAAFVRHEAGDGRRGSGDLRVEQRISPNLALGLGIYATWQRSADPALASFVEAGAFCAITVEFGRGPARRL